MVTTGAVEGCEGAGEEGAHSVRSIVTTVRCVMVMYGCVGESGVSSQLVSQCSQAFCVRRTDIKLSGGGRERTSVAGWWVSGKSGSCEPGIGLGGAGWVGTPIAYE